MEFTQLQIAKLVLGYLKKENCQAALLAFCDVSPHLKHFAEMIKNKKKYFITRVNGLSLVDYLKEYAVIYTFVQERLEDTEYFEENHSKNLIDQLRYLLDKSGRQNRENTPARSSRSSTPMKDQNKEHKRLHFPKNLSCIEEATACDATPLQALPGNNEEDLPDKCPKTSLPIENGISDSEENPDKSLEEDDLSLQVLTQTLLEHHELHEKIAENINLVRSTTEVAAVASLTENRISSGILQELDSAIKAIVQKTEADPIFEKLIGDIIGNVGETTDEEQIDGVISNENAEISEKCTHNEEVDLEFEENSVEQRPRSSKKQSPEKHITEEQRLNCVVPENQNTAQPSSSVEVIENLATSDLTKVNVQQNLTVNTTTGEVILYDGTLDNFMKSSTSTISQSSNPVVYNNGLLMVQPSVPALMPAVNTLQVNPSKPCYVWNGSQLVNVSVPQLKVNNLTEQDILTMPTVIVCDDNQQGILNNLVVPTSTSQQPTAMIQKRYVNIAPRLDKTADKAENISEYLTLYQCNDSNDDLLSQNTQNLKPQVKSKKKSKKGAKKTCQPTTIHIEVLNPKEEIPSNEINVKVENQELTLPKIENNQEIEAAAGDADLNVNGSKTPELFKKNSERHRTLSTPKSGSLSHVRALDFNFGTPGKPGTETTSPKTTKKSPKKSPKVSATKISKSLFGTPTKNQKVSSSSVEDECDKNSDKVDNKIIQEDVTEGTNDIEAATKEETKKASNSWDSDLRALTGPVSDRCPTPKRKRKDNIRNRKSVKRAKIGDTNSSMESPNKNNNSLKSSREKLKRRQKIGVKDATTPNKIIKRKFPLTTEKPDKTIKLDEEEIKPVKSVEEAKTSADVNCVKESETNDVPAASEMSFSLINCNAKARYKRKCNIDNNVKKEVKITKVKEIKSLEFINDGSNKLILSPSKLNANKRTLVEVDEKETKLQCASEGESKKPFEEMVVIEQTMLQSESQEDKLPQSNPISSGEVTSKFITPEMQNVALVQQPVISKRNITPILETPMKVIASQCPKTPGILSPVNNMDTPFTKVFKEQFHCVDISCIQTPKFPLTPNFPFTPTANDVSPYPIRPSDYSTSSSYYQPSDTEQNKSLEQLMIDECKRLENKKDTPVKINVKEDEECPALPEVNEGEIQSTAKKVTETEQDLTNKAIVEKIKSLSSNVIARKNLNLMDKSDLKADNSSCSSTSSDDTSETSSSDDESDDCMWNSSNNATVVQQNNSDTMKSLRYNLRSRGDDVSKVQEKQAADVEKSTEMIQQIISEVDIKPILETSVKVSTLSNHQEKVLQEMEEKRQRMIAKLKDDQNVIVTAKASPPTTEKRKRKLRSGKNTPDVIKKPVLPPRKPNGRFIKLNSNSKKKSKPTVIKSANRRKSSLPQKILPDEKDTNVVETENHPCEKFVRDVEDIKLHLNSDSDGTKLEPFDVVETELRESSTSSTPLLISKIPEIHPLKNFHKVLESITTTQSEKNKESNSDQEAESLVKGLKEWGIHLIHNKSPKKQNKAQENAVPSNHDGKNLVILQVSAKSETENKKNEKNDARLMQRIPKTNDSEKPCESANGKELICLQTDAKKDEFIKKDNIVENVQETFKVNQSLEEGEILSEEECRESVKIKKSKAKYVEKFTKSRTVEKKPIQRHKSSSLPRKNYLNNSSRSKVERKASSSLKSSLEKKTNTSPKSTVKKKTNTSSKPKTERKSAPPKPKTEEAETIQKVDTTKKIPSEIASVNKILDDLNISNSITELAFDIKTFPEENLHLVYDESQICNKPATQYNSELLNKKIAAKVYIESIDAEIEKFMTVTPFAFILDIPEELDGKCSEPKVKILDCVTIPAKKDAKFNTVVENMKGNMSAISPLNNLYESQTSGRYGTKLMKSKKMSCTSSGRRKSVDQQTQSSVVPRQSRSKSLDQKMLLTDKSRVKFPDKEKKIKDVSQTKQKKSVEKDSSGCNVSTIKNSTEIDKTKVDEVKESLKEVRTVVEISESMIDRNVTVVDCGSDDLMNYAVCGSQRIENIEEPGCKESANKTVASNKLPNCQELLSTLNVDVFLDKLHGE